MKFEETRELFYQYFLREFNLCEVVLDNQKAEINPLKQYISFSIEDYKKDILEIGFNSFLLTGILSITVYTPEGAGLSKNWKIIDKLSELFFNKKVENFYCKGLEINNAGFNDTFFLYSIKIPFEGDFF